MMIGGFFDARHPGWSDADMDWFEAFLEEQDVDIMAWAFKAQDVPARWQGTMMDMLTLLDFVEVVR